MCMTYTITENLAMWINAAGVIELKGRPQLKEKPVKDTRRCGSCCKCFIHEVGQTEPRKYRQMGEKRKRSIIYINISSVIYICKFNKASKFGIS